jgi:hypothetical protein
LIALKPKSVGLSNESVSSGDLTGWGLAMSFHAQRQTLLEKDAQILSIEGG